jgi:hypothetical protein
MMDCRIKSGNDEKTDSNLKQRVFPSSSSGLTERSSHHRLGLLDARLRGHDK